MRNALIETFCVPGVHATCLIRSSSTTTTILVVFVIRIRLIIVIIIVIIISTLFRGPTFRSRARLGWVIFRVKARARDVLASLRIDRAAGLHLDAH